VDSSNDAGPRPSASEPAGAPHTAKAFTTYDIQACLYDKQRVEYLRTAIMQTVREYVRAADGADVVVVDAGSGTGLLGLFAAQAGATRVHCVELNPEFRSVIENNAFNNDLQKQIVVADADATTWEPPEKFDVLISEVISAGFFYEPQIQIVNHLSAWLKPGGAVVPMSMGNYVELINAQEMLHGLKFSFDSRFTELSEDQPLTHRARYLSTDFRKPHGPWIQSSARVSAFDSGAVNAVKITYDIEFAAGVSADQPTDFLLNPQIIFLREQMKVEAGWDYDVALAYRASDNPTNCAIEITPVRV